MPLGQRRKLIRRERSPLCMKLFKRDRRSANEKKMDEYRSLHERMETLQREYAILLMESNHGKNRNEYERGAHEQALRKKGEIDAVVERIREIGRSLSHAQGRARARYESTKPGVEGAYQAFARGMSMKSESNSHVRAAGITIQRNARKKIDPHIAAIRKRAQLPGDASRVNWGAPPSKLKTALKAFSTWVRRKRRAA